jgi:integrase
MAEKRKKRENGLGTLEYLPDVDRWRVRLTVETSGGKRRKSLTAKRKKDVIAKRDAFLRRHHGIAFDAESLTVSAYLDRWIEDGVKQSRRPSTVTEYESVCRVHLKPHLGRLKLGDLKAAHVQALLSERRREGYAEGTCRRIYAILGSALSQAVKWQLIALSPMAGVDAPKVPRRTGRTALTLEETRRLFAAASEWRGGRLYPLLLLAVSTGMRQGEILGLFWEDVDLGAGVISVRRTLHRDAGIRYGPPKGGRTRRVEIDERLAAVLREQRRRQLEERVAASAWASESVFTTTEGKPIHRAVLYQSFRRLCKREGLPEITFHELRHTCATLMAREGQQPGTVMRMLGHADIRTTLNLYSHEFPGEQRRAATALSDILF